MNIARAYALPVALALLAALGACGKEHERPAPAAQAEARPASDPTATTAPVEPSLASLADAATPERREAGKRLYEQGAMTKGVAPCTTCHGAGGEGNSAGGFPRLAGQPLHYLHHQLAAYADGSRKNPVMAPIAQGLDDEQRLALAAYLATLPAQAPNEADASAAQPTEGRGATLAMRGDDAAGIQACANCHGPGGTGLPPVYPYLAGQHASYLESALKAWADGNRRTDPSAQMNAIAAMLEAKDVEAVAAYFAALPPPARATDISAPGTAAAGDETRSGPTQPAQPMQGTGVEQGEPTTGGTQGPGGGGASGSGSSGQPTGSGSTQDERGSSPDRQDEEP